MGQDDKESHAQEQSKQYVLRAWQVFVEYSHAMRIFISAKHSCLLAALLFIANKNTTKYIYQTHCHLSTTFSGK